MDIGSEIAVFRAFRRKMVAETLAATVALALAGAAWMGSSTAVGIGLGGVAGAACFWLMGQEVQARATMGVRQAFGRARRGVAARWALRGVALLCAAAMGRSALIGACCGLFTAQVVLLFRGGSLLSDPDTLESEK